MLSKVFISGLMFVSVLESITIDTIEFQSEIDFDQYKTKLIFFSSLFF